MEVHHLTLCTIMLSSLTSAPMRFCHSAFDVSILSMYPLCSIHIKIWQRDERDVTHSLEVALAREAGRRAPVLIDMTACLMPTLFMRIRRARS